MKKIGYYLFSVFFYVYSILPVKKNKVFCIMTHDDSPGSNVGVVIEKLKSLGQYEFHYMRKSDKDIGNQSDKLKSIFDFFLVKPYHLATSSIILQDNIFLPMAFLKFRNQVKVVQLWHGTGTIKKFGQSVNKGELKELEFKANQTITHLIINGSSMRSIYQEAFAIADSKIYELGLPRTDLLFCKEKVRKLQKDFFQEYPFLKGKKIVMYAPTFRDTEVKRPSIGIDLLHFIHHTPDDVVIGLKTHPYVARNFEQNCKLTREESQRVIDFSLYPNTNELLAIADVLVSDYSSIIFEYSILRKPMLFYAYDYKNFEDYQRGFYEEYESFVPGEVIYDQETLEKTISAWNFDNSKADAFVKQQYKYTDGQSTKRLVKLLKK